MNASKELDLKASPRLICCADEVRDLDLTSANDGELPNAALQPLPDIGEIERLYRALDLVRPDTHPRTAQLLEGGKRKMGQKLIEEASEVAFECLRHRARGVVRESADLIYHLVVLWRECGVAPEEVFAEMRQRAEILGIAEKLPKPAKS
jgi:phosphoribosyl-ATP pyrophosphohydrolase